MANQYKGFRATRPTVIFISEEKQTYQVYFDIYPPVGKRIPYRFSKDINNLKPSQRKAKAEDFALAFYDGMKDGWNPLVQKYPAWELERAAIESFTFRTGLEHALKLKKKELSKWSYYDYAGTVRFMTNAAVECGLASISLNAIKRKDIRLIVATAKEQREWTANSRNKYLTLLKSLLSKLVDEEIIEVNPAHKIKDEQAPKGKGYRRITDQEHDRIVRHLYENHLDYLEYVLTIEDLMIRRKELLMIQVGDINLKERTLTVREEVAKTNTKRVLPITDDLLGILLRRQIYNLPATWYIFSKNKFAPGPEMYHPNSATSWWYQLVQDHKKGLGINCKMYAMKHRGGDVKILAGINIEAIKELCGHKSLQMTEIYVKELKKVHANEIIEKSPSLMAKVVQMKKAE